MTRYQFVDESIKESDIHPNEIFKREYSLARDFVLSAEKEEQVGKCLLCESDRKEVIFEKWGYKYMICPETWSLSLDPIPSDDIYKAYFFESDLAKFRSSGSYQSSTTKYRQELWSSLIEWIEGRVRRYIGMDKYHVIDYGSRMTGWVDSLKKAEFVNKFGCHDALPPVTEEHIGTAEIICAIDVLQRQRDPQGFLKNINKSLKDNGLLIITCRAGSGFDILTLREKSNTIFPLDHIILPSPKGMEKLLQKAGFEVLEISTPGQFDVEFVKKSQDQIPTDQYLQRYIIEQCDENMTERLQLFLQRNNLSSYIRAVAKKVGDDK